MKKVNPALLARGYISEVAFSAVVLAGTLLLLPMTAMVGVLHDVAGKLAMVTGGLAAASFSMLGLYFSQTSSDFGKYLSWKGVSTAYLMVFGVAAVYQVVCTVALVFMAAFISATLSAICIFMLAMSFANMISMISNLVFIIRLRDKFNDELRKVSHPSRHSNSGQ